MIDTQSSETSPYFIEVGDGFTFRTVNRLFNQVEASTPKWETASDLYLRVRIKVARCGEKIRQLLLDALRRGCRLKFKIHILIGECFRVHETSKELKSLETAKKAKSAKHERWIRHRESRFHQHRLCRR